MQEYLFTYGTLQKEKTQVELFGRILHSSKDVLEGYTISIIEIKDESFLAKDEDKQQRTLVATNNKRDTIEGTVLKISGEELKQADKYEPANYKRIKVALASGKEAWIYIAT